eukprot:gene7926-8781_t
MANEAEVLVVGAEGSGKSLFLKRFQSIMQDENRNFDNIPSTISTIGTNLASVSFNKRKINLRELGGAMAPIWKNYYSDGKGLIFIVDSSNRFQISASTILFYDVLSSESLNNIPVLLLFNKTDLISSVSIDEVKFIMRVNDLLKCAKQTIDILECSLKNGDGIQEIINWLVSV